MRMKVIAAALVVFMVMAVFPSPFANCIVFKSEITVSPKSPAIVKSPA